MIFDFHCINGILNITTFQKSINALFFSECQQKNLLFENFKSTHWGLTIENASPDSVRGVRPQGVRLLDIENNRNWLRCSTWNWIQERKR